MPFTEKTSDLKRGCGGASIVERNGRDGIGKEKRL